MVTLCGRRCVVAERYLKKVIEVVFWSKSLWVLPHILFQGLGVFSIRFSYRLDLSPCVCSGGCLIHLSNIPTSGCDGHYERINIHKRYNDCVYLYIARHDRVNCEGAPANPSFLFKANADECTKLSSQPTIPP